MIRLAAMVLFLAMGWAQAAETANPGNWPNFGNDPGGSQFSALDQINTRNVQNLAPAWTHRSGDVSGRESPTGATALESIPIIVNDSLYYCTPFNRVFALDPATGLEKWVFDPHTGRNGAPPLTSAPRKSGICRYVSYWQASEADPGGLCQKRIFKGDINGNIYAIDADTGQSCADFGAGKGHPGYVTHADFEANGTGDDSRGITSGPVVIGDLVVAAAGARDSITDANDGIVRAFDARSGELKWEFNPIPPDHVHDTGAANVWSTISTDPERGLVFIPTSSPSSDYYGGNRTFDIPYSDATVALSAETGRPVWAFQAIRHDLFDHDLPGHPLLVTITKDGRSIPVAIQPNKLGSHFVLDRETGAPVFPIEERPVPQSDIPGEKTSPTQPFPLLPEPSARQVLTEDDMWGLTPIDRAWCRAEFKKLSYAGPYTPPSERGSLVFPFGGTNWGGTAYDAKNNLLIVKGQNMALRVGYAKRDVPPGSNDPPYRASPALFLSPLGVPCTPPPFGTVTAIDMSTGKIKWQVPLGQAKYWGITAPKFLGWGSPNIGGPMVTGGGLVFIAASIDAKLRALDVNSGDELWQAKLAAPGMSVPVTYMAGGRQYVVVSAGGNSRITDDISDAVMAFALPPP